MNVRSRLVIAHLLFADKKRPYGFMALIAFDSTTKGVVMMIGIAFATIHLINKTISNFEHTSNVETHQRRQSKMEFVMNWDQVEGNWKQVKGEAKKQWGKLTDDELTQINGNREKLAGKIQERYGYAKEKVGQEIDSFCNACNSKT